MRRTKWWLTTSVVSALSVVGYQKMMTRFDEKKFDTSKGLVNDFFMKSGASQEQAEGLADGLLNETPVNAYITSSIILVLVIFGISLMLLSIKRRKLKSVRL